MTTLPTGIQCKGCGRVVKTGLVFLGGIKAWIPFCDKCMYKRKNRIGLAVVATGMNEETLAENMEVSRTTIRSWRKGRVKRPKTPNLEKLASLAGVSVGWLEGKEENPAS